VIVFVHNLVVMLPTYFIFQITHVKLLVTSTSFEIFIKDSKRLRVIRAIVITFLLIMNAMSSILYALSTDGSIDYTWDTIGIIVTVLFNVMDTCMVLYFLKSLRYFVTKKINTLLLRQRQLTRKQWTIVVWAYSLPTLNLINLQLRIIITLMTRLEATKAWEFQTGHAALSLFITVVNFLTCFSLLWLFAYMSRASNSM
jgi:hypothetical protein